MYEGGPNPDLVEIQEAQYWMKELPKLSPIQDQSLTRPFLEEEIREAVFAPHPLKSPGPDGAPSLFFQEKWASIKYEMLALEREKSIQGIKVARSAPSISHLFFADDALFCFKPTPTAIKTLKQTLDKFCKLSGEAVNFQKSAILFSPNTPARFTSGCEKSIMSVILRFLWSNKNQGKPIYWISREVLCAHKSVGGLGMKNIKHVNRALLMRQRWRLYTHPELLASKIFAKKYGDNPISLGYRGRVPPHGSWAEQSLVKATLKMKSGLGRIIGDGTSTDITQDVWAQEKRLQPKTRFYEMGMNKVSDLMTNGRCWNAPLIWSTFEQEDTRNILSICIPEQGEDRFQWMPEESGTYSFKSGYWWQDQKLQAGEANGGWGELWKIKTWPKCIILA
uniref:Reverse transcriptase domain-containing protein n=1 Tax=Chenopodium quinoa TaxID=63459 RepID=A0A803LJ40_CHEQI